MNSAYRAFGNIVLILQPGEKTGQYTTDIINRHLADTAFCLIFIKIQTKVICLYILRILPNGFEYVSNRRIVISDRFIRTTLNSLSCEEGSHECGLIVYIIGSGTLFWFQILLQRNPKHLLLIR